MLRRVRLNLCRLKSLYTFARTAVASERTSNLGEGLKFIVSEITMCRAGRQDQVVIFKWGIGLAQIIHQHSVVRDIYAGNLCQCHGHVALAAEQMPDRRGDVARRQRGSRNLVKERLKQVMVGPVNHGDRTGDFSWPGRP